MKVGRPSSETFDEHERPTVQRACIENGAGANANATTKMKPFDLDQVVENGSGTRPVVTLAQIDRYVKERSVEPEAQPQGDVADPPKAGGAPRSGIADVADVDIRDRETIDALTLQRETLIIRPLDDEARAATPPIPIDVDLSRLMMPTPRPAAGRPVPLADRLSARRGRRQLTSAVTIVIAMISALLGFVAGRL
jgi:hypothetical protein